MKTASVSELKARLSYYLREVRHGGEVQVLDRGRPVARLTGLDVRNEGDLESHRERLVSDGMLRPGRGGTRTILELPPVETVTGVAKALVDDRADRL